MDQGNAEEEADGIARGFEGYEEFLADVKSQIQTARVRAAFAVSCELVSLYWRIGQGLATRQERQGWGDRALRRLASDL